MTSPIIAALLGYIAVILTSLLLILCCLADNLAKHLRGPRESDVQTYIKEAGE